LALLTAFATSTFAFQTSGKVLALIFGLWASYDLYIYGLLHNPRIRYLNNHFPDFGQSSGFHYSAFGPLTISTSTVFTQKVKFDGKNKTLSGSTTFVSFSAHIRHLHFQTLGRDSAC
jgi:hypothetical protein